MKIYLDYAATTPVCKESFETMIPYFELEGGGFGNAGSLHSFGQKAQSVLDKARIDLAKTITAHHREIIFTSSATEANNLVIRGVVKSYFKNSHNCKIVPKIIISAIEHPSIMETAKALADDGSIELLIAPVNQDGIVDVSWIEKNLDERVVLISVMWVNNETGAIQPITEIVKIVNNFREELRIKNNELRANSLFIIHNSLFPLVHSDAVQAFNYFDLNVAKSQIDLMTLSSHKIYGPKGAGALYIKNSELITKNNKKDSSSLVHNSSFIIPITTGGGQEYGLRSGTENIPAIVGFAKAAQISHSQIKEESARLNALKKIFWNLLKENFTDVVLNGGDKSSCHILNVYFSSHKNLSLALDIEGVAVSSGSACAQRYQKPSPVLSAMGYDEVVAKESIRFSFGRYTTEEELKETIKIILKITNNK